MKIANAAFFLSCSSSSRHQHHHGHEPGNELAAHRNIDINLITKLHTHVHTHAHAHVLHPRRPTSTVLLQSSEPESTSENDTLASASPPLESQLQTYPELQEQEEQWLVEVQANANNNTDASSNSDSNSNSTEEFLDPIMILPIATLSAIALLFLGVAYTFTTNPVVDFDIDFYMALDGLKDVNHLDDGTGTGSGSGAGSGTIVGLPKLSAAEQLVGALFGPK